MELVSSYRDIALLKALHWRLFSVFRWLVRSTAGHLSQSVILALVRDMASTTNDTEMENAI